MFGQQSQSTEQCLVATQVTFGHHVWLCLIVFDNISHLRDDKHFIIVKHFVRLDDVGAYLTPFGHSVKHQYVWSPDK